MIRCPECGATSSQTSFAIDEQATIESGDAALDRRVTEHGVPPVTGPAGIAGLVGGLAGFVFGLGVSFGWLATVGLALLSGGTLGLAVHTIIADPHRATFGRSAEQRDCARCGARVEHPSPGDRAHDAPPKPSRDPTTPPPRRSAKSSRCGVYAQRVDAPVQRARSETDRDARGLLQIVQRAGADGAFNPFKPSALDVGLVSRLASLGYLAWDASGDTLALTPSRRSRSENLRG